MKSNARTVEAYLDELPKDRGNVITKALEAIRGSIRPGFDEVMNWGMITWEVPLSIFPKTYNKKPLMYCALAAQKNHYGLYLMNVYSDSKALEVLEAGYEKAGIKLDMGKSCIRFKSLDGVHLPTIRKVVKSHSAKSWTKHYLECRGG